MKNAKRWLALFLLLTMILSSATFAGQKEGITYTALGDSIAFGVGASLPELEGYTDMFNEHLEKIYGPGTFLNLSFPGKTSGELLADLQTGDLDLLMQISQKITISIGGNDLLRPVINIVELVMVPELFMAMLTTPIEGWMGLVMLHQPAIAPLVGFELMQLEMNMMNFHDNWLDIITYIRGQNQTAQVFVNTVYNPFEDYPEFHAIVDEMLDAINVPIWLYAEPFGYCVVDVYGMFDDYDNPQKLATHNLSTMEELAIIERPFSPLTPYLHPTDRGYKFIFNMHKDLLIE